MSAYLVLGCNILAVLSGTAGGCLLRRYISPVLRDNSMTYFSVISAALGIQMLSRVSHFAAVVLAFLLGGIVGHCLKIDRRVYSLAEKVQDNGQGDTAKTLLVAFTLFCISTAGILGALDLGFLGDPTLLMTKAIMDFLSAVFFAASCGWILSVISLPLGVILVCFYLLSTMIAPYLSEEMIGNFSACGGLIQLVNALRIAKLKDPPVLDLIPGLLLIIPITYLWPFH
ncbi:DUF554 domain-containing protein [Pseudoflavonifractor phocaeensis]|uniref:DUF554 domain-containing protein n=1 Tax=Pseudoflavonifractor phocaeensis TaxID=1870988 RepID=UPI001F37562A|nr:DUF554 domain-containing protein [Pseudoflavonifractor phocaeensis]MCF2661536.1 DUF554 domain-containing protein [Pseudoflavonifractor phocaeensis]